MNMRAIKELLCVSCQVTKSSAIQDSLSIRKSLEPYKVNEYYPVLQTQSSNCAMLQEEYPVQEEDASLEIFSTLIMLKIQMLSQVNKNTEIYSFQHTRKIHHLTILFLSLY